MLANSYKTADDLGIKEVERNALINILHDLECGELKIENGPRVELIQGEFVDIPLDVHSIRMDRWFTRHECGTVGCLAGTAHIQTNGEAFPELGLFSRRDSRDVDEWARAYIAVAKDMQARIPFALWHLFMSYRDNNEMITKRLRKFLETGKSLIV